MAAAVRDGFCRYALRIQYHGGSFLGFMKQKHEDCITNDVDLRGYTSVQSRLERALHRLVGDDGYDNLQISSRTDRGVHALGNTLHIDIAENRLTPKQLHLGLNYWLAREHSPYDPSTIGHKRLRDANLVCKGDDWVRHSPMGDVRVLAAAEAPRRMRNLHAIGEEGEWIHWNARFSATSRTYLYRILAGRDIDTAAVWEWDRSWRIPYPLDVEAMRHAAVSATGEHDFTSFRARGCERSSPIMALQSIEIAERPYGQWELGWGADSASLQLVTILLTGNAFLYRQVRNLTGCLVEVGRGRLAPSAVEQILAARDRRIAPAMAPAQGLFLANVQHGDFVI